MRPENDAFAFGVADGASRRLVGPAMPAQLVHYADPLKMRPAASFSFWAACRYSLTSFCPAWPLSMCRPPSSSARIASAPSPPSCEAWNNQTVRVAVRVLPRELEPSSDVLGVAGLGYDPQLVTDALFRGLTLAPIHVGVQCHAEGISSGLTAAPSRPAPCRRIAAVPVPWSPVPPQALLPFLLRKASKRGRPWRAASSPPYSCRSWCPLRTVSERRGGRRP